jgi:hypothetical protein
LPNYRRIIIMRVKDANLVEVNFRLRREHREWLHQTARENYRSSNAHLLAILDREMAADKRETEAAGR